MSKWEYKIIDSRDVARDSFFKGRNREKLEAHLNLLGDTGWEIINLDFNDIHESAGFFLGVAKRAQDR